MIEATAIVATIWTLDDCSGNYGDRIPIVGWRMLVSQKDIVLHFVEPTTARVDSVQPQIPAAGDRIIIEVATTRVVANIDLCSVVSGPIALGKNLKTLVAVLPHNVVSDHGLGWIIHESPTVQNNTLTVRMRISPAPSSTLRGTRGIGRFVDKILLYNNVCSGVGVLVRWNHRYATAANTVRTKAVGSVVDNPSDHCSLIRSSIINTDVAGIESSEIASAGNVVDEGNMMPHDTSLCS